MLAQRRQRQTANSSRANARTFERTVVSSAASSSAPQTAQLALTRGLRQIAASQAGHVPMEAEIEQRAAADADGRARRAAARDEDVHERPQRQVEREDAAARGELVADAQRDLGRPR